MPFTGEDPERRDHARTPIELKVEYKKLNTFFADYTKNICKGGTFIKTKKPLEVGTEFVFKLLVPRLGDPLALRGQVKWVVREGEEPPPDSEAAGHEPGMGIRFIYATDAERQVISEIVERLMIDSLGQLVYSKLMGKGHPLMDTKRFFRYLAPNLVTLASLTFGMCSLVASIQGQFAEAGWFIVFSVLTDKLDGFVARLVKGTSEFGVQLDSFADFLNFGVAPAALFYTYLGRPESPLGSGLLHAALAASCFVWVLAVVFRLARYNIVGDDPRCKRIFFGVPTTLMGGLLAALFLMLLKYGADPSGAPVTVNDDPRLLGRLRIGSGVWLVWPPLLAIGAFLMASAIKIPKLGTSKSKILTGFIFLNVLIGYVAGATRHVPEVLCFDATMWVLASLIWGTVNRTVKGLRPPPIFPRTDPHPSQLPQRPEEDAVPDEDEAGEHVAPAVSK